MNKQPEDNALRQMTQRLFFAWMFGAIMIYLILLVFNVFSPASAVDKDIWSDFITKLWSVWMIVVGLTWGVVRLCRFFYEAAAELLDMWDKSREKKKPANIGLFDRDSKRLEDLTLDEAVVLDHVSTRRLEEKR